MKNLSVTSKRCLELAHVIRSGSTGLRLDMGSYVNNCGTAACVAGHALYLYDRKLFNDSQLNLTKGFSERDRAKELLGLTDDQALPLFGYSPKTPKWVAEKLEQYAMENAR